MWDISASGLWDKLADLRDKSASGLLGEIGLYVGHIGFWSLG